MSQLQRYSAKHIFLNLSLFRVVYILSLYFCSFYFVNVPAVVIKYALMVWAVWLIYFYYIRARRIFQVLYARWLLGFISSALLTALLHVVDNFLPNMVMLLHIIICFFIFYGMHTERNKKRIKREIYFICAAIVFITTLLNAAGLCMVFITGKINIPLAGPMIIFENRFTGFYTNPNLLGFHAVAAVFCAHMLSKKDFISESGKQAFPKWVLILSAVVNILSMFLSDSNASLVLLGMYIMGMLICKFFMGRPAMNVFSIAKKGLALLGCLLVLISSLLVVRMGANMGFSAIVKNNKIEFIASPSLSEEIKEAPTFQHINKNVGSGRDKLLQEAIALFVNYPLFGIGKENLVEYGQRYIEGGLHSPDLHNGYLTILVSSGIIGFAIFIGFAIHVARHCLKSLFLEKRSLKHSIFPCLFSFILAYCVYSAFEKTLLYEQTFMVVFFWLVLGYTGCYMLKFNHIEDKFDTTALFKKKANQNLDVIDVPTEDEIV